MTDTTRDAFEAWFTNGIGGLRLTRIDDTYTLMAARSGWEAWQAATLAEKRQPLTDIDALAKVYASSYASPHHITFTVEGLRAMIAAAHGIKA